jgi:hypothetical protein
LKEQFPEGKTLFDGARGLAAKLVEIRERAIKALALVVEFLAEVAKHKV